MITTYSGTTSVYKKESDGQFTYLGYLSTGGSSDVTKIYEKQSNGDLLYLGDLSKTGSADAIKLYENGEEWPPLYLGDITTTDVPKAWEPYVRTQGLHFIVNAPWASSDMIFSDNLNEEDEFEVYVNGNHVTNIRKNEESLQGYIQAGDEVLIKCISGLFRRVQFNSVALYTSCISEFLEPLPLCFSPSTNLPYRYIPSLCSGLNSLTSIPANFLGNYRDALDCSTLFQNCKALTALPPDLFKGFSKVVDLTSAFAYCSGLTEIPEGIFDDLTSCKTFDKAFNMCNNLTSIPVDLLKYNTSATSISGLFWYASKLTPIVRVGSTKVTNVSNFAYSAKSKGTVYVPSGSTTATTFKNTSNANVTVVEE